MANALGQRGLTLRVDLGAHRTPPVRELRRRVRDGLPDLCAECVKDLELFITELVKNAYEHGGRARHVVVRRSTAPPLVRIDVSDTDHDALPVVRPVQAQAERGRGLVLVSTLATRWGVDVEPDGKTVWAELRCYTMEAFSSQVR